MKFKIRKLIFLVVLFALVAAPFAYTEYRSSTTTDPYILVARELERGTPGVDVLGAEDHPNLNGLMTIVFYIKDFPDWSVRQDQPNFQRAVLQAVARQDYTGALIIIGWDFPPPDYRVQGLWLCPELRRLSCEWEMVLGRQIPDKYMQWPGIGNP
jgi:hypothetical protein